MKMSDLTRKKSWMEEAADDLRVSHGFNHFVVAQSTAINEDGSSAILHMVGYENPITSENLNDLIRELSEDNEFDMTEMVFEEDYVFFDLEDIKETMEDRKAGSLK